ncbi:MAG: hypothetical protein AMK74_03995 [Nitrospira bacterium SM23_35]|jgi:UDP-glucose 4-epimerase|nr:MAG: hypothetical protein AMK74_03995 [Nitrospira bacterium SM23_35]
MILVVGGAGYIGSHVTKLLNKRGFRTVVFDNLVRGHKELVRWGEFVFGDLADRDQIRICFEKYPVEVVMHFSAFAYIGESVIHPARYYLNNVAYTLNLLEVMKEFHVRHFIFSSTCAVYGIPGEMPIVEDHPKNPVNPYGRSKLMIEDILKDYDRAYGIKHVNLRYFNAAGADPECEIGEWHEPETHLIPLAIYAALGINNHVQVFGTDYPTKDGTCIRDYIHVLDLADAHIQAIGYLKSNDESDCFNLGNGTGHSVKEVLDTVKIVSKRDFKIIESDRRPGDPPVLVSSYQKAADMLGWKPHYADIDSIIETAFRWHSKKSVDNSSVLAG